MEILRFLVSKSLSLIHILFGASAIGGTINIITKEPTRNSAELAHSLMSIGGSCSFENNTTLNASLVTEDNKAGFYVYGQNRYRSGYDNDGDGYTCLLYTSRCV